jgi:hypothetical protein
MRKKTSKTIGQIREEMRDEDLRSQIEFLRKKLINERTENLWNNSKGAYGISVVYANKESARIEAELQIEKELKKEKSRKRRHDNLIRSETRA